MRLRYVGTFPTTFVELGLEVLPDEEFSVDGDEVSRYLSRDDIVEVRETSPQKSSRTRRQPEEPEPVAPEQVEDVVPVDVQDSVSDVPVV